MKKVKVPRLRTPRPRMNPPRRPVLDNGDEPELLAGVVQDLPASAIEERFARALDKKRIPYIFRYAVGAPRGMPGHKEVDFLVEKNGMIYPVEVDTEFTHRRKGEADRLKDAIVLNELEREGYQVFPQVLRVQGETELTDQRQADRTVDKLL